MKTISDVTLHNILDVLGFRSDRVLWAIEILRGRIHPMEIRYGSRLTCENNLILHKQIVRAAMRLREGHIEVRRRDEEEDS